MSNLIKYSFVDLKDKDTYVIDYEKEEKNNFVSFREKKPEKPVTMVTDGNDSTGESGEFEPGVPVKNFDDIFREQEVEAKKRAEKIIEEAREQAEQILQEAEEQIETARNLAREEGFSQGRQEGIADGEEALNIRIQELEREKADNEKKYQQMLEEIEPKYAEILCSLLQKLTGILVTDKKDVMLYLIRSSMADMNPAKHYTIRVSAEDVMYAESHREEILLQAGGDVIVDVQEEKGLSKGECIIETDTQMLDCGFRTQLDNMMLTIRMLAGK